MDFVNESRNGRVPVPTGRSAFWTAPGDTAPRTLVGWNIEIMFAMAGIIFYHTLSKNRNLKILGVPEAWFRAVGYSVFSAFVECKLNAAGLPIWEYPF